MVSLALVWVWVAGAEVPVAIGTAVVASSGLGLRTAVCLLRAHHGGEDLLPGRSIRVSPGCRGSAIEGWLAAPASASSAPDGLDSRQHRACAAARVAGPAGQDIGWTYKINEEPAEAVGWPELVHSVAAVWHALPARPARPCGHVHRQLRRGGRNQRAGTECRPPDRRERAEQRVVLGSRRSQGHDGCGRGAWSCRRDGLRLVPEPVLPTRARCGDAVQHGRAPQPGMGWAHLHLHRTATPMGSHVADAPPLRLNAPRIGSRPVSAARQEAPREAGMMRMCR